MSSPITKIIPSPLVNPSGIFPANPLIASKNKETIINTANQGVIEITYSRALVKLTKIVATMKETNKLTNLLSPRILYLASTANKTVNTSKKLRIGRYA